MLKYPRKIEVLGREFQIKWLSELEDGSLGDTEYHDGIIRMSKKELKDEELKERVLLHELVHAALGVSGVSEQLPAKTEEAICTAVSSAFYSIYRRKK